MARHRQRARDRKSRQDPIHREDVPGELDHASGEVDEVEASIVAGANGEPTDLDDEALAAEALAGGGGDGDAPPTRPGDRAEPGRPAAGARPGGHRPANLPRAS